MISYRTPLRIVLGADTYPPDLNGAARFTQRLARGLAGRGHDVHVLCPSADGPAGVRGDGRVREHRLRAYRIPLHPSFRVCLPWQVTAAAHDHLRILKPNLVHVQSHFVVGRALVEAAARVGVPTVATNHFMPENLLGYAHVPTPLHAPVSRWAWRDLARVYRHARVLTAPTPSAVELLARAAGLPGALPVSCGIDLDRFHPGAKPVGDPRVLFVGRLDPEKRVHELLQALAALPDDVPVRAEIVGDGACRRQLEALTDRLGIRALVRFRGVVSEEELVGAHQRAAVFCMPGTAELQSLATMEAMATGTPILAADAMALPHLVRPGRTGWLYPPGDVAAMTAGLLRLLSDPELSRRMGLAGRELVAAHAFDRTLDAYEDVYADATSDRGQLQPAAAWIP